MATKGKKRPAVKSKKGRTSKKRKPKVALRGKAVAVLAGIIVGLCISLLLTNFIASRDSAKLNQLAGQKELNNTFSEENNNKIAENVPKDFSKKGINTEKTIKAQEAPVQKDIQEKSAENKETAKNQVNKDVTKKFTEKDKASSSVQSEKNNTEKKVEESTIKKENKTESKVEQKINKDSPLASVKPRPQPDSQLQEASKKFNIPPAKNGATLVFVIDDGGMSVANVKKYTALPFPITIAVLPKLPHSADCAWAVRSGGKELMLHQPMQAKNLKISPGPGAISPQMDSYQIEKTILENLAELGPGVKGFNNHEGSLITEDKLKMIFIIDIASQKGLYFLDSRTSSQSQARQAALELDSKIIERNAPFLDNAVTRQEMLKELYKGLDVANKAGYAVIIGHVDKSASILPPLLKEMYPELKRKGYKFATPSQLR